MKINRLVIENFKSIEQIELIEPNPFTVFVGPNGSGKSNIFEALEFLDITWTSGAEVSQDLFGGEKKFLNRRSGDKFVKIDLIFEEHHFHLAKYYSEHARYQIYGPNYNEPRTSRILQIMAEEDRRKGGQILKNFSRVFPKNRELVKLPYKGDNRLSLDADNLEPVLKRILTNNTLRAEIFEWLELFVPGFKAVEIDDRNELHWFEESTSDYFTKDLISDGTYNILALLTAVYQSEEPQFLCIEEPENGLHPQVLMTLVDFFRQQCEEKGHYIWLNTHSESLVRKLRPEEIILVDKREGATHTKQVGGRDFYDLQMDEAWLTGALGGGLPW